MLDKIPPAAPNGNALSFRGRVRISRAPLQAAVGPDRVYAFAGFDLTSWLDDIMVLPARRGR